MRRSPMEAAPLGGKGYHTLADVTLIPGTDTLGCTYADRGTPSWILTKSFRDKGFSWGRSSN